MSINGQHFRQTTKAAKCEHGAGVKERFLSRLTPLSIGVVGALLFGGGVFAAWAPTASVTSGSIGAANLTAQLVDTNGTTFTAGVSKLLPGDWLNRYADLTNNGSVAQTFTGTVTGTGTLGAGLTAQVDTCSVAWASNGTCSGSTSSIVAATSTASPVSLTFPSMAASAVSHVRFRFLLPTNASQVTYQATSGVESVTLAGSATVAGGQDRTAG